MAPVALLYRREAEGWQPELFEGLEAVIALPEIGARLALAEIYDASSGTFNRTAPRLVNVSARTQVGTGDSILIAGFAIGGFVHHMAGFLQALHQIALRFQIVFDYENAHDFSHPCMN